MKTVVFSILSLFIGAQALCGTGGGGVVRPGMNFFVGFNGRENSLFEGGSRVGTLGQILPILDSRKLDFVKTIRFDNSGKVLFKYKSFDSPEIVTHAVDVSEFNENYLDAIKKSHKSKGWEPVTVEGLGN